MKKYIFVFALGILNLSVFSSQTEESKKYLVQIDIQNIKDDKVEVSVYPPVLSGEAIYNMPKIIPGTYAVSNFGRFVEDFKAISHSGSELEVEQIDENRWKIMEGDSLSHLIYLVNDSYDEPHGGDIFEPSGTNIEADENVVLNAFGFAGYFEGAKNIPFELEVTRPEFFYGETSLKREVTTTNIDKFHARDYFEFHDCPILYSKPDTASVTVAGARIAVAVYSPTNAISAQDVMNTVEDIFPAAANYLGGELPVDQYSILVYLNRGMGGTGSFGALEHHTSTVFFLPEAPIQALEQTLKDVTAHEFFHIVTPLNIHSEEINDYDFMNPKMSQHLWMYEGCTEYAAQHVQVKEGLMPMDQFLDVVQEKMMAASSYDSGIAFTEMSKKALDEHADQYLNVYQQGALIGMAIDLKLRHLSNGEYGIQDLMASLTERYGQDKAFKDEELFAVIAEESGYPEMEEFLERHVAGTDPIPFDELLGYAGIRYVETITENSVSGGNIPLGYNPETEKLVVASTDNMDDFGKAMGFQVGDEIVLWNGEPVSLEGIRTVLNNYKESVQPGDKVVVVVNREVSAGKYKKLKLKAKAIQTERTRRNVLEPMKEPTEEQLNIRKAWINV